MEHDFWKTRWQQNEIGFHLEERHEFLSRFYHLLHVGPEVVLVPLCGKSPDLIWIREQGARVLGIELSEIAVKDFFADNRLDVSVDSLGCFERYHGEGITLLCGDLFDLHSGLMEDVRAVYDRGALVALPKEMRQGYASHLCAILPVDSRILLVSYDYDQNEIAGPPFSVPLAEVDELFGAEFNLELLDEQDALPTHNILRERGVSRLSEFACLLTHK